MSGHCKTVLRPFLTVVVIMTCGISIPASANDNPALGIGEPNTPWTPPPPPPPCETPPCDQCNASGSPVFVSSGTLFLDFKDLAYTPGGALDFDIARVWRSTEFYVGFFGRGFHSTLDMMAIPTIKGQDPNELVIVRSPNGQRAHYTKQPDGSYSSPLARYDTLAKVPGGFTRETLEGIVYTYDEDTKLLRMEDRHGNDIAFTYDGSGRPQTITFFNNRSIQIAYHPNGLVGSITDFAGRTVQYDYDANGYLTSFTDAVNAVWTYEYDGGRLARIIDPLARVAMSVTYDAQGRVSRLISDEGDFTYTYLSATQTRKTDNSNNAQWTFTFDANGVVTRVAAPNGGITQLAYDGAYNLTRLTDANSRVSTFSYDSLGRMLVEADGLNNTISYTYNSLNLVATKSTPSGTLASATYDAEGNLLTLTEAVGDAIERVTTFEYDGAGNVTRVIDPLGAGETYEYDAYNNPTRMVDKRGIVTTATRNVLGNVLTMTEAAGTALARSTTYTYDALDRVRTVTYDDSSTTTTEYDPAGNMSAFVDENNHRTEYEYDQFKRLVLERDALGNAAQYTRNTNGYVTAKTDKRNNITTYAYDLMGSLTQMTDALNNVTTYAYDLTGDYRTRMTDPLTRVTQYEYDAAYRMTRMVHPNASTTQWTYNSTDRLTGMTDELGRVTTYTYDKLGRQTSATYPLGCTTTAAYDANDRIVTDTNSQGQSTTYTYDPNGNLLSETDPLGNATYYAYDELNRLTSFTDAETNTTSYVYDVRDRAVQVTWPDGNTVDVAYDAVGNRTSLTDEADFARTYEYDTLNRLSRELLADGAEMLRGYDPNGNLLGMTDANGNATQYAYDALNRKVSAMDALAAVETFAYDAVGNLTRTQDRNNRVITYAYDARYRRTNETWDNGRVYTFTYDAVGNILTAVDALSSVTRTYDALNRTLTESNTGTPGAPLYSVTYTHDCVNTANMTDSKGAVTGYQYDVRPRLTQIIHGGTAAAKTVDLSYNANNQIVSIDRNDPSLPMTTMAYDTRARLTQITHGALASHTYMLDARADITRMVDAEGTHDYAYNAIRQLTSVDHPDGSGQPDESYNYDLVQNRTSSHLHGANYQVNAANRLLTDGTYNYTYDAVGNLLTRTDISTGDELRFTYNHRNRPISAQLLTGGSPTMTAAYTYDAFNRRIAKTVGGATTHHGYDAGHAIVELDGSGNVTARYMAGPDLDQWLADERGGQVHWLLADHLGAVRDIVDSAGALINHYTYDSFGQALAQTDPGVINPLRFTGRYFDDETGLYDYRTRWMDSSLGRFTTPDLIGLWGDAGNLGNAYSYVGNNPLAFRDPLGLKTYLCRKPLGRDPDTPDQRTGPDIPGNPLYHQYICIETNGTFHCMGQTTNRPPYGPGAPSNDRYLPHRCKEVEPDNECFEKCLRKADAAPRPYYGLVGPGTNCQEWSNDAIKKCRKECDAGLPHPPAVAVLLVLVSAYIVRRWAIANPGERRIRS